MDSEDIEKGKAIIIVDLVEYFPKSVIVKTIVEKSTGNVRMISCDRGEEFPYKTIAYDNFVQIIDGEAEVIIDGISTQLCTGQSIIIPAHKSNSIKAIEKFKLISTIIKSGYEELS